MSTEHELVRVLDEEAFAELYWRACKGDREALRNMKHAYVTALIALERLDEEFDFIEAYLADSREILVRTPPAQGFYLFTDKEEVEKTFRKQRPG